MKAAEGLKHQTPKTPRRGAPLSADKGLSHMSLFVFAFEDAILRQHSQSEGSNNDDA